MFTDDDVLMTRAQRWHRRVMAINRDALLQWALVAAAISMTVSSLLLVLGAVLSGLSALRSLW